MFDEELRRVQNSGNTDTLIDPISRLQSLIEMKSKQFENIQIYFERTHDAGINSK